MESANIAAFEKTFLLERFDGPALIPQLHRDIWDLATSGLKRIAIAAPRDHAKSTAVTHVLTLYLFLFRMRRYGIVVSDTEGQASQFLGDIKTELLENKSLREVFGIKRLIKDAVTDIIVECDDGHVFRIQALGAEQKVRGRKWRNLRPDFIIGDDLENDEMVESDDRREKSRSWFFKALVPCLSKHGIIIIVGTILHMDSILMRLMNNKEWESRLYKAHESFDDFTNLLWPERWSEADLKRVRDEFIADGNAEGYAQEYLNDPTASGESFFSKQDFKTMEDEMKQLSLTKYAAVDLAISDQDRRAYTVILVGGMDEFNRLHIIHVLRFRGDANDIVEALLEIQRLHGIEMWKIEQGQIKQTLMSELNRRMEETGTYLNLSPAIPTKDKRSRARGIQARMRAGGVYFDKEAEWYPAFEQELLQFPKGTYKDQVDAIAWLGICINELHSGPTKDEIREEQYHYQMEEFESESFGLGRNETTGY